MSHLLFGLKLVSSSHTALACTAGPTGVSGDQTWLASSELGETKLADLLAGTVYSLQLTVCSLQLTVYIAEFPSMVFVTTCPRYT